MNHNLHYARPSSLGEALAFLWERGQDTAILAGGTDLLIDLRDKKLRSRFLLDVSRIPELKTLELREDGLHVGAGLTFSEILASDLVDRLAPVLGHAASTIGSRQIRNVATLGGNVAHCSPCADSVPALLVHETRVVLSSLQGDRLLPLQDFLRGPYRNAREPEEIVSRVILEPMAGGFCRFEKLARRRELATARLTLAAMIRKDGQGRATSVRVALGSGTPSPRRVEAVEGHLLGHCLGEARLWEAGEILAREMIGTSGARPSTVYKEKAVQGLLVRAFYPLVENDGIF